MMDTQAPATSEGDHGPGCDGPLNCTCTETKRFDQLRRGDQFVCPASGQVERVIVSTARRDGRWFVRTNRHDHNVDRTRTVEASR